MGADDTGRDAESFALRVPTNGTVASLRALLDCLDEHSVPIETLSLRTPDLDDVFFALTGAGATSRETESRNESEAVR